MSYSLCCLNIQTLFFTRYDLYIMLHLASHVITGVSSEENSEHLIVILECGSVEVQLKKQTTTSVLTGSPRFLMWHSDEFLLEITYWLPPKSTAVKNYRSTFHVELSNVSIFFVQSQGFEQNRHIKTAWFTALSDAIVKRNAGKYESESGKNWAFLHFLMRIWPSLDLFLHVRLHIVFQMLTWSNFCWMLV